VLRLKRDADTDRVIASGSRSIAADPQRHSQLPPSPGLPSASTPSRSAPAVSTIAQPPHSTNTAIAPAGRSYLKIGGTIAAIALVAIFTVFFWQSRQHRAPATVKSGSAPTQHALTRLTFDDGQQIGATWSPDGRFIAYSSDRGGKFDVWVRLVSGGDPVQIAKGSGNNWQPDWSPDGKNIAYRSEDGGVCSLCPR